MLGTGWHAYTTNVAHTHREDRSRSASGTKASASSPRGGKTPLDRPKAPGFEVSPHRPTNRERFRSYQRPHHILTSACGFAATQRGDTRLKPTPFVGLPRRPLAGTFSSKPLVGRSGLEERDYWYSRIVMALPWQSSWQLPWSWMTSTTKAHND
jgi:hypothetical protein